MLLLKMMIIYMKNEIQACEQEGEIASLITYLSYQGSDFLVFWNAEQAS